MSYKEYLNSRLNELSNSLHKSMSKITDKIVNSFYKDNPQISIPSYTFGEYIKNSIWNGEYLLKKVNRDAFISFKIKGMDKSEAKKLLDHLKKFKKTFKGTTYFEKNIYLENDSNFIVLGFVQKNQK